MAPCTHPFRCPDTTIDSFFVTWFFRLLLPSYHDKKKLNTVSTYLIKFFLIISNSAWAQTSLSNLQELNEKAPFRGWGVGLRVRSGLSAALSQRDIRNARGRWVIMGRVRGWKAPEQCASRQKRTQPLLGVVVGVGACWRSCAHRAVLSRQAPKWWTGRRRGICSPELRG